MGCGKDFEGVAGDDKSGSYLIRKSVEMWGTPVLAGSLAFSGHLGHHWPVVYKTGWKGSTKRETR